VLALLNVLDSFIGIVLAVIHLSRINIRLHGLFNWGGAIFLSFGFDNTERLVRRRKGYCKKAV
jgi:hypothetical protein